MSIIGVGTDIVSIKRIEEILSKHSERFLKRILTKAERLELPQKTKSRVHFVSKRWAAKEALSKAFASGIGTELSFQDLEIQHKPSGAPIVILSKRGQQLAMLKGIKNFHISISDENEYAVAFVIAST